jgi:hypothetical protein
MRKTSKFAHQPRLDTIKMIEYFIRDHSGEYSKTTLWRKLPKKVMYQTYKKALNYLEESNKITFNGKRAIWIFNPTLMKHLLKKSVEV